MRRALSFASHEEKAQWLDAMASLDARLEPVRALAARIAVADGPNARGMVARDLHRWVRDRIHYVPDPTWEEFADSAAILDRGFDDCDGKARLFVALCRAVGLDARIRPVFLRHPHAFVHVQADVRWPGSEREPLSQSGGWMLAELILAGCELGEDPDRVSRGPGGERILS